MINDVVMAQHTTTPAKQQFQESKLKTRELNDTSGYRHNPGERVEITDPLRSNVSFAVPRVDTVREREPGAHQKQGVLTGIRPPQD